MNELKRRQLALPEDTWRQIKSRAAMEGMTIAGYITKLVNTQMITPMYRRGIVAGEDDQPELRLRQEEPATPDVAKAVTSSASFGFPRPAPKGKSK